MKKQLASLKEFYAENKTIIGFTVTTTLVAAVATQQIGLHQHKKFLEDKGLVAEFFGNEED